MPYGVDYGMVSMWQLGTWYHINDVGCFHEFRQYILVVDDVSHNSEYNSLHGFKTSDAKKISLRPWYQTLRVICEAFDASNII